MTQVVPSFGASLREELTTFRDFIEEHHARPGAYASDLDLVLQHGREYRSVPWTTWRGRGYRRGKAKECFKNAALLGARHPDLTYVEGFATSGLLPVHHAWLVDSEGRVIDPTWRYDDSDRRPVELWEYLGVPFSWRYWAEVVTPKGRYGILDEPDIYREPLPDWAVRQEEEER